MTGTFLFRIDNSLLIVAAKMSSDHEKQNTEYNVAQVTLRECKTHDQHVDTTPSRGVGGRWSDGHFRPERMWGLILANFASFLEYFNAKTAVPALPWSFPPGLFPPVFSNPVFSLGPFHSRSVLH